MFKEKSYRTLKKLETIKEENIDNFRLCFTGNLRDENGLSSYAGAIFILENGIHREFQAFYDSLDNTIPTQAEYYSLLHGLKLACSLNIRNLNIFSHHDIIQHFFSDEEKNIKNSILASLYFEIREILEKFDVIKFNYISKEKNRRAIKLDNCAFKNKQQNQKHYSQIKHN